MMEFLFYLNMFCIAVVCWFGYCVIAMNFVLWMQFNSSTRFWVTRRENEKKSFIVRVWVYFANLMMFPVANLVNKGAVLHISVIEEGFARGIFTEKEMLEYYRKLVHDGQKIAEKKLSKSDVCWSEKDRGFAKTS